MSLLGVSLPPPLSPAHVRKSQHAFRGDSFPSAISLNDNAARTAPLITLKIRLYLVLLACTLALVGCEAVHYYGQAVSGHFRLLSRRISIDDAIAATATPPATRESLKTARDARRYASDVMQLPRNKSYTQYAPLERDAVTYNVVATPEFSLEPKPWCFLIVGCVNYRGYFSLDDAQEKAAELRAQGFDVVITHAAAYSTLGWFADPLPGPVLAWPEERIASLIFHELAHQKLYLRDQTGFNESYASAVALLGVRGWRENLGPVAIDRLTQRQRVFQLLHPTMTALQTLYASKASTESKRTEKARLFREAQGRFQQIAMDLPHWKGWFAELNNARLASLSDYTRGIQSFEKLFIACKQQWGCFHERAREMGAHWDVEP